MTRHRYRILYYSLFFLVIAGLSAVHAKTFDELKSCCEEEALKEDKDLDKFSECCMKALNKGEKLDAAVIKNAIYSTILVAEKENLKKKDKQRFWGIYTGMEDMCRKAIEIEPGMGDLYALKAVLEISKYGHTKTALSDMDRAVKISPDSGLVNMLAAVQYYNAKKYEKAYRAAERLEASPNAKYRKIAQNVKSRIKKEDPGKPEELLLRGKFVKYSRGPRPEARHRNIKVIANEKEFLVSNVPSTGRELSSGQYIELYVRPASKYHSFLRWTKDFTVMLKRNSMVQVEGEITHVDVNRSALTLYKKNMNTKKMDRYDLYEVENVNRFKLHMTAEFELEITYAHPPANSTSGDRYDCKYISHTVIKEPGEIITGKLLNKGLNSRIRLLPSGYKQETAPMRS